MKKILFVLIAVCIFANSLPVVALEDYVESYAYTELSDKLGGCEEIGAFVDYKYLVDRNLPKLSGMNSAERQQLVAEILTKAGAVYINGRTIDFTDGELAQYLLYAAVNVAEAKSYLKHHGISSITNVPLTIDFGKRTEVSFEMFRSFLSTAYKCGVSHILIKNHSLGFMLDVEELSEAVDDSVFFVSLIGYKADELLTEIKQAVKSDMVYRLVLSTQEEISAPFPESKALFYNGTDENRIYCIDDSSEQVRHRLVGSAYNGNAVYTDINKYRWFGLYKPELLPTGAFSDITAEHWAYEYIDYLSANGVVSGSGGKFNPDDNVTREEFVKMLVGALSLNNPDAQCDFADVTEDKWYYSYVASAYTCGITGGVEDNRFGVGQNVSRQDIAVMAVRAFECRQLPMDPVLTGFAYFADGDDISDYAREAVMAMYICGFVSGDEDSCFNPHAPATRAEVAKILYMIVNYIERI